LEQGNPQLPKKIEDIDKIALSNILNVSKPKLFPKFLKNLEVDSGTKMRKINKN